MKKSTVILSAILLLSFLGAAFSVAPCLRITGKENYCDAAVLSFNENDETQTLLNELINGIIDWKKSDVNAEKYDGKLLSPEFLALAGTTPGDWYPIGLGRYGYEDDYDAYLAVISDKVSERYLQAGKLSKYKATEWHRIALAITAMGGDPTSVGEFEGKPINLIADGTYDRGKTTSCGRQGINGWIWALITLDSKAYAVPEDAFNQRGDFIAEIARQQLSDGGFALSGTVSDPDITAMAIQALAPYYNSETVYSYASAKLTDEDGNKLKINKKVRDIVDESLAWLSSVQKEDGDFSSWGTVNVESTCQVAVALCSLNIDPLTDERFIKNGNTLLDGIRKYRLDNGGFVHSFVYDPDNPTSKPNEANTMASEQTLYTLVAIMRKLNGYRALYDMRAEFTAEEREFLDSVSERLGSLTDTSDEKEVKSALDAFLSVQAFDIRYVENYNNLVRQCERVGLTVPENEELKKGTSSGGEDVILYFAESDKKSADSLPSEENLTTEYYAEIVRLRYLLEKSEDFEGKEVYSLKVNRAYEKVRLIQQEIDSINDEIRDKLNPFENIGLKDSDTVNDIAKRVAALSDYDRSKITHGEDLLKACTQINNLRTALIISAVLVVVAAVLCAALVMNVKARKAKKAASSMGESDE